MSFKISEPITDKKLIPPWNKWVFKFIAINNEYPTHMMFSPFGRSNENYAILELKWFDKPKEEREKELQNIVKALYP